MEDSSKLYEVAPGLTIRWCLIPPVPSPPLCLDCCAERGGTPGPSGTTASATVAPRSSTTVPSSSAGGVDFWVAATHLPFPPSCLTPHPIAGYGFCACSLSSSLRLMRRLPQGRWTKTTATTTTTTLETPEQDEQQQQAQKPRKRPCALPTGQLTDRTDKPTNRPTEPNSNQRQRHNNPNQQRRPTTTDNRPVNRQALSNSGYLVVPYGKFVREIQQVL